MSKDGDRQVGVGTTGQASCLGADGNQIVAPGPALYPWDESRHDQKARKTYQRKAQKAHGDAHLRDAMIITGMTGKELGVAMGLSTAAVPAWLKDGNIPLWSVLAVEGLLTRHRKEDALFVVSLSHDQQDTVRTVLTGLGCKVAKIK
jgi:hypothetical protein